MGKQVPKMSSRVVTAIRNLREAHGSTSKEIMNYILSQHDASEPIVQRQMNAALKRGLDYGILKKNNGHYFLNTAADLQQIAPLLAPAERRGRKGRRRGRRRRSRRRRGGRRRSRRGRSRGKGRRRRSRRGRRRGRGRGKVRSVGRTKRIACRCTKRTKDMQVLENEPLERHAHEDETCCCERKNDERRSRSRPSKTPDRRPPSKTPDRSRSRSTVNSDREAADDRQADS